MARRSTATKLITLISCLSMQRVAGAIAGLGLVMIASCGGSATQTLTGTVTVYEWDWFFPLISGAQNVVFAQRGIELADFLDMSEEEQTPIDEESLALILGTDCSAGVGGGIPDIQADALVQVRDERDIIVATGRLGSGTVVLIPRGEFSRVACALGFEVTEVPSSDFYQIEIANRNVLIYSPEELQERDWTIDLQIGLDN